MRRDTTRAADGAPSDSSAPCSPFPTGCSYRGTSCRRRRGFRRAYGCPCPRRLRDPATGADTDNRMLFEIRVAGDSWFLDSYNQSGTASTALMNRTALHPLRAWYHVASVYDGREFSNYVDGVK